MEIEPMATDLISGVNILNREAAQRKLRRMAFQIAEDNAGEAALIIAGIIGNGALLAQKLVAELKKIIQIPIEQLTIELDKRNLLQVVVTPEKDWNGTVLIVVDDVSNTGKTLLYALKPFLEAQPKKIQTLVLVERSHKLFSIQPDYVGVSITTTLQEHISVVTKDGEIEGAWLY
ncbi:MAG TPA: phosphoribosyltransferase family protein [Chitinophagaceae bacterium]|nr:phosphoribosyltransferase family protein [Chitinophagaceae bacterium]